MLHQKGGMQRMRKQNIKKKNTKKANARSTNLKKTNIRETRVRKANAANKNIERRKQNFGKKLTRKMRKKLAQTLGVFVLVLFGLAGNLTYINMTNGNKYGIKVLSQQGYQSRVLPYKRGNITDRNGVVLATSTTVYNLILDAKLILSDTDGSSLQAVLLALNHCFNYDIADIRAKIEGNPESQYIIYNRELTYEQIEEFHNLQNGNFEERPDWFPAETYKLADLNGVWFEEGSVRSYPYGTLACDVLGFSNSENVGSYGMEQYYNNTLNGTNGRIYGYLNEDNDLEKVIKSAIDGNTVVSTIDINLQMIAEKWIHQYMEEVGAANVAIMMMNPNNGEILAEASAPVFDLNDPSDISAFFTDAELEAMTSEEKMNFRYGLWKNFCISEVYEPGSTQKPFTVAAALDEGSIKQTDNYLCEGRLFVGDSFIHCHNTSGDGWLTLGESIMYSCNVALMKIAQSMGREKFAASQRLFGMGSRTGVDLPGEEEGLLYSASRMGAADLATNSFGQNFNVTATQMIAGFCSLINGGNYYQPHIMKKVVEPSGGTVKTYEPILVKSTISKGTSDLIREYLYQTVEGGTGRKAAIEGYTIGGKTGTAEKHPRDKERYLVSFLCFAPVEDPQIVCYFIIDEPNIPDQDDASQATVMAHNVLLEVLPYMGIYPNQPITKEPEEETTTEGETEETTEEETETTTYPESHFNESYFGQGFMGETTVEGESTAEEETSTEGETTSE